MTQNKILPDLIDRPAAAMRAVVARPKSWWIAAALLVAALVAHSLVTAPYYQAAQAEAQAAMIERLAAQATSQEQAEAMRAAAGSAAVAQPTLITILGTVVGAAVGWLLWAGGAHLGSLFLGGRGQFAGTWAVTVWSQLPRALEQLVSIAYTAIRGAVPAHQGLAFLVASGDLVADSANPAYLVLASVTPFAVWSLILLAIGVHAATGLGRTAATILILLLWAIALTMRLTPALLMSSIFG